eukprot:7628117-Ditylum_brightwellii.AAC.1
MLTVLMYKVNGAAALDFSDVNIECNATCATRIPTASPTSLAKNGTVKITFERILCQLGKQESVDIEFEVKMKRECQTSECVDAGQISNDVYKDVVGDFNYAVSSGSLTTAIQEEASDQGATTLQTNPALSKLGSPKSRLQKNMVIMVVGV